MAITQSDGSIVLTTKVDEGGINKSLTSMQSGVKSVGARVAKLGANAAKAFFAISAAATAATVAIVKQATDAYAEYEQLVGGVETLFKDSSQKLIEYANEAYMTAGVSANEYMKQVTSFSASLISSTAGDTDKAADVANMALIDISDNVNKMGSTMESVTLAYQGFAKQQYMLLDNLKLGYGGTKTEMERLLKDAQAITGVKYDINNLADVYNAIHVIQEELGIAGTTAKEAAETISGSAAAMKSAWQNLITAIGGGGCIEKAMRNITQTFKSYIDNLEPVIQSAMDGLGEAINTLAPVIVENFSRALIKAIPTLLTTIYEMIVGLAKGIWEGITALFSGEKVDLLSKQKEAIDEATKSQNALTEAVEETEKAQKGALAGFDEINRLTTSTSDNEDDLSLGIDETNISNVSSEMNNLKEETSATNKELTGLAKAWNEFRTQVKSKLDLKNIYEMDNAWTKLKNSMSDFAKAFDFGGFSLDIESMYADYVNWGIDKSAALATGASGFVDVATSLRNADAEGLYQAIGRIAGAGGQFFGIDDSWFDSITTEVHNIYEGLSTETINELQSFQDLYAQVNGLINSIMFDFQDALISDKEVSMIGSALDVLFADISEKSAENHEQASQYLQSLVSQGLMTKEDAAKSLKKLDDVYKDREKLLKNNQTSILNIIKKANEEERALTADERQQIQDLMTESNNEVTSTIAQGADDRTKILQQLNENEENLSVVRYAQIVKFANSEYETSVKSANDKYNAAITNADKLYYELGVIDEEEYKRVKKAAEDTRKAEVDEAKKSKEDLIKLAQEKAGGVADAVDPESGEILSRWEILWNRMWGVVKNSLNKVIDGINSIIRGWLSVGDSIRGVFGGTKLADIIQIPRLATGTVVPPNREFLAVLGDNKKETEVVSPLSTMKQAFAETLASTNFNSIQGNGDIVIQLDGREIARAIRTNNEQLGTQTVYGGFANVY